MQGHIPKSRIAFQVHKELVTNFNFHTAEGSPQAHMGISMSDILIALQSKATSTQGHTYVISLAS